ncbi:fibrobacter succinogenes major paralogous domain-containing protein, partial [Fibrobacter sp.]|uniref:fibrobacter succinogenes major paralogous domain-containing protein n=1 Tax=Fibrobacter sp. TaxID=35828 RepID=UPI00388ECE06
EDQLKPTTPAKPKSSSSKKTDEDVDSSDSDDPESSASEEECTGRRCKTGSSSSKKPSGGNGGSGSGDSGEGGGEGGEGGSGSEEETPDGLPACNAALKDTVKWTGEFTSAGSLIPDETKAGKYYACDGSKWAEVTKLHYAFGATCEAFKNRIQQVYDKDYIIDPEHYSDPFTEEKVLNSDLNVLTDGNGTVFSGAGKALGRLIPEWNGHNVIYTYNGVEYTNPLCKDDEYTVAPVGASAIRRLCTKNNVGDRGRAYKQQGSTVYGDNYWVCYEKGDGTYEWGRGLVDSRTATGTVGDPKRWGDIYRMVTIGEQTWMAENVNYETTEGSYCYNNEAENCEKHGRLYTWEQAYNNACPTGWHLPSKNEFEVLIASSDGATVFDEDNTAGAKLKASYGWPTGKNGTDDYGFSTLPGGMYYTQGSNGFKFDDSAMFWSATEGSDVYEYYSMSVKEDAALLISYLNWRAHSVRCVKD